MLKNKDQPRLPAVVGLAAQICLRIASPILRDDRYNEMRSLLGKSEPFT